MTDDVAPVLGPIGTLLEQAYGYAGLGLEIFPVNPRDKTPLTSQLQATTDLDTITAWWQRWPDALIGHRISPVHLILDIDPRHGGLDTWNTLKPQLPEFVSRCHYSGRGDGGGHIWFQRPADKVTITQLDQWARQHGVGHQVNDRWVCGIDILRREHRYTILPPSHHPETGRPYFWGNGRGLNVEPAPMPQLLMDLIVKDDTPALPPPPPREHDPNSPADNYSATQPWNTLLPAHGWTLAGGDGTTDGSRWRHPQASNPFSATIRHGCLFVYSPNTPFDVTYPSEPHGYTPFRALAVLEHAGDLTDAARALRATSTPPELTSIDLEDDTDPFFVPWPRFWEHTPNDNEWLIDDVLAVGRGHVIYAYHKQGKSLFTLCETAQLAITRTDVDVIYLDYEMTRDDLRERLESMGHGPGTDLSRLHYALLPTLPPLDTPEGAAALLDIVHCTRRPDTRTLVVIDTTGRAVKGEENSNDTIREFYRHTGLALKRAGVTWVRLDHAGKDPTKGQRGGSAKGDDVDIVWKLVRGDNGITLHCDASRIDATPHQVVFQVVDEPLTYKRAPRMVPAGTDEVVQLLDRLLVPVDASNMAAVRALRDANEGRRKALVIAAQNARRDAALTSYPQKQQGVPGTPPEHREQGVPGNGSVPATPYGGQGGTTPHDGTNESEPEDTLCAFTGGSTWCTRNPCPNPDHRTNPALEEF